MRLTSARWIAICLFGLTFQTFSAGDTLPSTTPDGRALKLEQFFRTYHCPAPHLVSDYLSAADANSIDYRLLPAVSVRESTCGQHARLNNRWGWDSAKTGFASLKHGLHYIARQLAEGKYYRGKSLDEKLLMYNPRPRYVVEIRKLMREIEED